MSEKRTAAAPTLARRVDGRVKLLLLVAACFVCQYLPAEWLPVWIAVLGTLFSSREMRSGEMRTMLRGGVVFILFWLVMTAGSDFLLGKGWREIVLAALPLGGKLLALTLVGMAFVGLSSPVETGRAAAWFMRPFLGRRVWKPALMVALTAWFLPMTLRMSGEVRAGMRARGLALSWRKKAFLLIGTSLRILEKTASDLALGLASRRLDDWRSWY